MAAPSIDELLALDVETKLALVQKLWDSIVEDANDATVLPLGTAELDVLEQRLRDDDDDPDAAIPWTVARRDLRRE